MEGSFVQLTSPHPLYRAPFKTLQWVEWNGLGVYFEEETLHPTVPSCCHITKLSLMCHSFLVCSWLSTGKREEEGWEKRVGYHRAEWCLVDRLKVIRRDESKLPGQLGRERLGFRRRWKESKHFLPLHLMAQGRGDYSWLLPRPCF